MIKFVEKFSTGKIILTLVLLFVPLYFFYLGVPGLWDEDESVYAEISRQMILRNDPVGTYFNYEPRYDKPPLNFWINAAFYKILGMNEFTTRINSTIFGFLCLILIYLMGKQLFSKKAGIYASLMLGTSFLFFIETQLALIDTTLTFFIGLTLYLLYLGFTEKKQYFWTLMGIPLGLGILAKGPVILVLTGAVTFIWLIFQTVKNKTSCKTSCLKLLKGLIIAIIIAGVICLPWYFTMWSRYGMDFIQSHFGYHMIKRFIQPIEHHGGGWYYNLYYVVLLFIGFMPWGAYIPKAFSLALKRWQEPKMFFLLTWILITFGFFTMAQTKLPGYTLPLFPPLALLMGYWWDQLFAGLKGKSNPLQGVIIQVLILLGVVTIITINKDALPPGYQNVIWVLFLLPLGLIVISLFILFWQRQSRSFKPLFFTTFFFFYLIWALFLILFVPLIENNKPVKYLAVKLRQHLREQDKVISAIRSNFTAPFYTRHKVIFVSSDKVLLKHYKGKSRIFAFVEAKSLVYLKKHNLPCFQLSHYGSGFLITNQPLG